MVPEYKRVPPCLGPESIELSAKNLRTRETIDREEHIYKCDLLDVQTVNPLLILFRVSIDLQGRSGGWRARGNGGGQVDASPCRLLHRGERSPIGAILRNLRRQCLFDLRGDLVLIDLMGRFLSSSSFHLKGMLQNGDTDLILCHMDLSLSLRSLPPLLSLSTGSDSFESSSFSVPQISP
ncbi:hypothetical protein CRG98_000815 [Punica granatum]|uniref:Uncharacterized protein n=1 Tax=Punica granatum TaxID=22663 RepID=A0A2I0LDJ8_PUNGR|nr:hypothetical protein CRG98_000815 [Punica granatum]